MNSKLSYLYYFLFICLLMNQNLFASSGGGSMSKEEIKRKGRMRSPMVLHCIDDYLKGNNYPLTLLNYFQHDRK